MDWNLLLRQFAVMSPLMKILIFGAISVGVFGLARFMGTASPRERKAVILAWLFPGLGHLAIGHRPRGLVLGGLVFATFLTGMILADFCNISPFDRHRIWGLCHAFGGAMSGVAAILTRNRMITHDNPLYPYGCLYSGVATLLNLLLILDVSDIVQREERQAAGRALVEAAKETTT